jgi:antitoxin (DNA-binding transcriptional repressor) of toxin-antitoxin stability system
LTAAQDYAERVKVNLQYAESHMAELAEAADRGETVEIARVGKPSLHLVHHLSSQIPRLPRAALFNSAKGKIWLADDWDSKETNDEIASLFDDGPVFPPGH